MCVDVKQRSTLMDGNDGWNETEKFVNEVYNILYVRQ